MTSRSGGQVQRGPGLQLGNHLVTEAGQRAGRGEVGELKVEPLHAAVGQAGQLAGDIGRGAGDQAAQPPKRRSARAATAGTSSVLAARPTGCWLETRAVPAS